MKISDLQSISIRLASPKDILSWSSGEVKKPETINYRTQKPEKDSLFCERIFGPSKDFECYCGKYKGIRYKGIVCDRCGVEVIRSQVRRERMGHIKLVSPVSHIWFLKGIPSSIGMVLNISEQKLERVVYFVSYIIDKVDEKAKKSLLDELEQEFKQKRKEIESGPASEKAKAKEIEKLKGRLLEAKREIESIKPLSVLSEVEYQNLSLKYGEIFTAGTGAEALAEIFKKINLKKEIEKLKKEAEKTPLSEKKKVLRRLKLFQGMYRAGIRPEWMFLTVLPVLPPDLRPMVQIDGGRYASSDLNDLYRRVINRNNRLKYLMDISAPAAIIRNEKRMLQEAVDSLLDNSMRKSQVTRASTGGKRLLKSLADILSGKQGRFRRNLLGKRVDYSGRSVIVAGPELNFGQCGIPKIMALELFKPFIIKELLDKEIAFNVRGASRLIDEKSPEVFSVLEDVVKGKLVLLNRAPTLHRLGIQAFEPVLIEEEAIKLHPLVCKAFNADFDGDQMGVFLPLSKEAQKESEEIMFSLRNFLKPAMGLPIVAPTLDIVLGCYWLTTADSEARGAGGAFGSFEEVLTAFSLNKIDIRALIRVIPTAAKAKKAVKDREGRRGVQKEGFLETTCGRIIFNEALPEKMDFINEQVDAKKLSDIIGRIVDMCSPQETAKALDRIKEVGFEYATFSGLTLGKDDFIVPKEKKEIIARKEKEIEMIEKEKKEGLLSEEEKSLRIIGVWHQAKEEIQKIVSQTMPKDNPISVIVNSGARGSWAQPVQICGMKGLVNSPSGKVIELPVRNSFKEGFDVLEFFLSTHGARKGSVDKALRTSASGYLTRRLVDVSHELILTEEDCRDTEGQEIFRSDAQEIGQKFSFKIVGRVALENIKSGGRLIVRKGEFIDWEKAKEIEKTDIKKVRVRSPLSCKTIRGICCKCYGWHMATNEPAKLGDAVGVVASQSIGEPGTQLTMRTFHLGGVAGGGDITQGLPRVEEIFELRSLKGEGVINLTDGWVKKIDLKGGEIIISPIISADKKTRAGKGKKSAKKDGKKEKTTKSNQEDKVYEIPLEADVFVKEGDRVSVGEILCSGPLDLKKLFKISGISAAQRYIIKEVQRVYVSEGINIHDKHIELITRQMFSRVKIIDPGDGPWVPEQIVSRAEFEENKKRIIKEGGSIPKAEVILLGISRVAITSDSFLSAASFQETSRVLIKAALEAKEDKLQGLKENVIIGRMIPAGTGFRRRK